MAATGSGTPRYPTKYPRASRLDDGIGDTFVQWIDLGSSAEMGGSIREEWYCGERRRTELPSTRSRLSEAGSVRHGPRSPDSRERWTKPLANTAPGGIQMNAVTTSIASTRRMSMPETIPTVFIVDDDVSVRESLEALVGGAGWRPEVFASARAFLDCPREASPSCLILDVGLPDLNGLELQERMAADRTDIPVIFITGYGDIPMTVRAMKAGATEFLTKPFDPDILLAAVRRALERSTANLADQEALRALRGRHGSLSRREREVMALVVRGRLNKQVGAELGISEITVKAHRGQVMRKMKAPSLAELVRLAARLGLATGHTG